MKIGYPCLNYSVNCTSYATFRLKNYSEKNLKEKIKNNLDCLSRILHYNLPNNLLFFRLSSDLIPFASHPICSFPWQTYFQPQFREIANFIQRHKFRISMHPEQFVMFNSPHSKVVKNSIVKLNYHANLMESLSLNSAHKIQIHVGGKYNNKKEGLKKFISSYKNLSPKIKKQLVIENNDKVITSRTVWLFIKKLKCQFHLILFTIIY